MSEFNRPALTDLLGQALGIKGPQILRKLEESVFPMIDLIALVNSPYESGVYGVPCGVMLAKAAGGAGTTPTAMLRPGANVLLEVLGFWIAVGTAQDRIQVGMLPGNSAVVTTGSTFTALATHKRANGGSSDVFRSSSAGTNNDTGVAVGGLFQIRAGPANQGFPVMFPAPWVLDPREKTSGAINVLAIQPVTQNQELYVTWFCREWPLPG